MFVKEEEIRINKNVSVIIPARLETADDMEKRAKYDDIKFDCMRQERKLRNKSRNYIQKFGNLIASLFI